jgi:hypothetical protein
MLALCVTTANAQIQWISADVGTPTFKGSAVLNGDGTWTIQGGGDDIWNDSSDFHYLYAWAAGTNWDVSAQFQSFTGPDTWSKVELLVDWADTTIGPQGQDPFIAMMDTQPTTVTPPYTGDGTDGEGVGGVDQYRTKSDGPADWKQVGATPAPNYPNDWFRIQRQGSVFNLFKSGDGVNWTNYISIDTSSTSLIGQDNGTSFGTPWPNIVAVGVAVTAHDDSWVDPSTELPAGATAVIANLQGTFPPATPPTALGVSQQIQSGTTNGLYCEASLTFAATNNAFPISAAYPVLYQWYKNNSAVVNATNTSYTWLLQSSDSGATCYCQASMAAPYNAIMLNSATATVGVLPVVYYTNGLKMEFFSYAPATPGPGVLDPRVWVEQGNVGPATWQKLEPNMDDPGGYGNYYAARVSGWFLPPTSDTYHFYVASDDDSDLWLSTDNTIANKRLIAQETSWNNIDQWLQGGVGGSATSYEQQCSDTFTPDNGATYPFASGIVLNAGQPYYIENVHYQGNGGDCMSVTYQTDTMKADPNWASLFTNGTPSLLYASNNVLVNATVPATYLTWVIQPTNTTTSVGFPAKFYSQASSDSQLQVLYQWYKGTPPTGVPVAGATAASFSTANAVAGDSGTTYYVVATTPENEFTITSSVATENVALPVLEYGWAKDELWYTADPGIAVFEVGVTNGVTGDVTVHLSTTYAVEPDHTIYEPKMETTSLDNSGQSDYTERVSALFYPPATDDYVFFVNSDDQSDLYISTDNTPANAVLVAQEVNWSNPWQWQQDSGAAGVNPTKCSATWADPAGNTPWASGIHMVKGTPYYIAGIHYQGGGGVNFEATFMSMSAYNANGSQPPANGAYSAFTGNLIASYVPQCFSMSFLQQPGTVTVPLGGVATLTALGATDSTSPVGNLDDPYAGNQWNNTVFYQWTRNGVPIAGANGSSYSFGPISPQDSTINFACTIRALGYYISGQPGWATSSVANIVVSGTPVYEPGFAIHEFYKLDPPLSSIENNTAGTPTWLMSSPAFEVDILGTDDLAGGTYDNFSDQLVGFFIPPTTASYVFFLNSDDNGALFLGTDTSASSRRMIAQETGWGSGVLEWGASAGTASQVRSDTFVDPTTGITLYSNGIPLVAGQKYFMQAVHEQGGGGTYTCVNYMLTTDLNYGGPGIGAPTSGSLSLIRGSQVGTYVPACTNVTITTQPQSVTVNSYASTTFTAGGTTDSTIPIGSEGDWTLFFNNFLEYQWYKNSTPVAGATASAFAMPEVLPSDNNSSIYCTMRALGYADASGNVLWQTSQVATLSVTVTAPQLLYAGMYANSNYLNWGAEVTQYITLTFSTPMNPVQLNQASSYILPSGLTLLGILVNSNNYECVDLAVAGTLASGAQISVSSSLAGLGGGLPLTGSTSVAVSTKVGLTDMDIGSLDDPAVPGVMYVNGAKAYTIQCEGSDQWNTADGFNFAYEMKTNDFDVVVRMKSTTHVSDWTKGGLMVRETLDPYSLDPTTAGTSRNWNIVNDPVTSDGIEAVDGSGYGANTIECNCRTNAGASSTSWETGKAWPPAYPNAWVRLARVGTVLNAYASTDGVSWTLLASADPTTNSPTSTPLPSVVYVGISTSAHDNDTVGVSPLLYVDTAVYDNFGDFVPVQTITMGAPVRGVGTITFTWTPTGVGTLYSSPALTGPNEDWEPVTNGTGTAGNITVPIGSGPLFFRVHNP